MSGPEIAWVDNFDRPGIRRLVLTVPLEWYVDQKSDRYARWRIAFWLCRMAPTLIKHGRLWK